MPAQTTKERRYEAFQDRNYLVVRMHRICGCGHSLCLSVGRRESIGRSRNRTSEGGAAAYASERGRRRETYHPACCGRRGRSWCGCRWWGRCCAPKVRLRALSALLLRQVFHVATLPLIWVNGATYCNCLCQIQFCPLVRPPSRTV